MASATYCTPKLSPCMVQGGIVVMSEIEQTQALDYYVFLIKAVPVKFYSIILCKNNNIRYLNVCKPNKFFICTLRTSILHTFNLHTRSHTFINTPNIRKT